MPELRRGFRQRRAVSTGTA